MEQNTESHLFELQLDHEATNYLGDTARWAKFLAILGFIGCGLLVIFAFAAGALFSSAYERSGISYTAGSYGTGFVVFLYIAMAILYFFPTLYLFRFASRMQIALKNNDQSLLSQSFKSLKSCFKFIGILTIIAMGLGILAFVLGLLSTGFR